VERGERAGRGLERGRIDRDQRWHLSLVAGDGGFQAELQLGLCSPEQRLVDLRLVGVEGDVGSSRVGVALKDDLLIGGDLEDAAQLEDANVSLGVLDRCRWLERRSGCRLLTYEHGWEQQTFSGRTCAPRSFSGSLNFFVCPRNSSFTTMGVSSVTGILVAIAGG
jgi:hypothetical protein